MRCVISAVVGVSIVFKTHRLTHFSFQKPPCSGYTNASLTYLALYLIFNHCREPSQTYWHICFLHSNTSSSSLIHCWFLVPSPFHCSYIGWFSYSTLWSTLGRMGEHSLIQNCQKPSSLSPKLAQVGTSMMKLREKDQQGVIIHQ